MSHPQDADTPDAAEDPGRPAPDTSTEAGVGEAPQRRRRTPRKKPDAQAAGEAPAVVTGVDDALPVAIGSAQGDAPAALDPVAGAAGDAGDAGAAGDAADGASRRSRRNRRRGRKGRAAREDGGGADEPGVQGTPGAEGGARAVVPLLPRPDAGELFASVTSGAFDTEVLPIDTATADTYADGIASRVAIPRAVELMAGRVDAMVTVGEEDLHAAQALLTAELGITVEGAAAASWAGLLAGPRPDGPVIVVITGSNV